MSNMVKHILIHTNSNGDKVPYPFVSTLPEILIESDLEGLRQSIGLEDYQEGDRIDIIPLGINAYTWPQASMSPDGRVIPGDRYLVVPIIADSRKETTATLLRSL